ncbi:MAG: hypothetical protein WEA99_09240 [Brumimicrobium sp.]
MKLNRSIFSVLLLSVYTLLLLHDFIPHTHHDNQQENSISSIDHHDHHSHDESHHSQEHHEKNDKDDNGSDSSENNLSDDHLVDSHNHSDHSGHQHDFTHRTVFKTDFVPVLLTFEYLPADLWKLPDRLNDYYSNQFAFVDSFPNPHLSSGHGLRGPPALS